MRTSTLVSFGALVAASACSFDSKTLQPDATFDAGEVDAPPGSATLTVRERGKPVVGVPVYFHEADGTTVIETMTDANGTAGAVIRDDGYASFIKRTTGGIDEITTFAKIQPRDQLELELSPEGRTDIATVTVIAGSDAGATAYVLYTTCGGPFGIDTSMPNEVTLVGCGGNADLLLVTTDENGTLIASQEKPSFSVENGGEARFDGPYVPALDAMIAVTMLPAGFTYVSTYQGLMSANGTFFESSAGTDIVAGAATIMLLQPKTGATMLTATYARPPDSERGEQVIYEWEPAMESYSLAYGAEMLRGYQDPIGYDGNTRTVRWNEAAGPNEPTYAITSIRIYRDDLPEGRAWRWRMVSPRLEASTTTATSAAFPTLPAGTFDLNPIATGCDDTPGCMMGCCDKIVVDELTTVAVPANYATVRTHAFDDTRRWITDQDGKMVIQRMFMPEPIEARPVSRIRYR